MQPTRTNPAGPCPRCGGKRSLGRRLKGAKREMMCTSSSATAAVTLIPVTTMSGFQRQLNPTISLFIAEDGSKPNRWNWEIRRKSKPMGAKVSETGFQSRQAAEFSGRRALSEFLIELRRKRRDYTRHAKNSPHEVVARCPLLAPSGHPLAAPHNVRFWG